MSCCCVVGLRRAGAAPMRRAWACPAFRWRTGRAATAYALQKGVRGHAEEQQRSLPSASRPCWMVMPPMDQVQSRTAGFQQSSTPRSLPTMSNSTWRGLRHLTQLASAAGCCDNARLQPALTRRGRLTRLPVALVKPRCCVAPRYARLASCVRTGSSCVKGCSHFLRFVLHRNQRRRAARARCFRRKVQSRSPSLMVAALLQPSARMQSSGRGRRWLH